MTDTVGRSRLRARDLVALALAGVRTRPTRAILSALGIAIGIGAMVSVMGISSSSQAQLNSQLEQLGTNLLTISPGKTLDGGKAELPEGAASKVGRIDGVDEVSWSSVMDGLFVYRNSLVDPGKTNAIQVQVAETNLLELVGGTVEKGTWLNDATAQLPAVVLGSTTAERLGIVTPGTLVWLGGQNAIVVGILDPVALAPELDASVLVGEAIARAQYGFTGHPTTIYERSPDQDVDNVRKLLGPTVNPQAANEVAISRPSDALAAKNASDQAFTGLLVGLGAVALLVGGIGIANTMIISVLERRNEIGLRRALGATRGHVRAQFLSEALVLSALGGMAGAGLGAAVTLAVSSVNGWPFALSLSVAGLAVAATLLIGAGAGLYPATRAARTPPTAALRA